MAVWIHASNGRRGVAVAGSDGWGVGAGVDGVGGGACWGLCGSGMEKVERWRVEDFYSSDAWWSIFKGRDGHEAKLMLLNSYKGSVRCTLYKKNMNLASSNQL